MMETHKIYIDYAITIISASYFYVSNALVSPDVDLIATDATSSLPSILSHPSPLSPPHHRMALQPMLPPTSIGLLGQGLAPSRCGCRTPDQGRGGGGSGTRCPSGSGINMLGVSDADRIEVERRFGDATTDGILDRCTRGGWRRPDQGHGGNSGTWDPTRSSIDVLGDGIANQIGNDEEER
jgi:hypothetical protein